MNYKKVLVTGGAGFIGHNLVKELISRGYAVKIIDNLSTGKKENLHPDAEFVFADITKLDEIKPHFTGVEGVFHVAALPRVPLSIEKPQETHEANVGGTLNVLIAARDAGVKKLVYSASSSAYGEQETLPLHEGLPAQPMHPYGLQKYIGELYAKIFANIYKLPTVSLRYFNVYGQGMADKGAYVTVMSIFKQLYDAGKPLTIIGDGEQTRDFTHINDVVNANILALESMKVGKGEVINIGAEDNHSVNEIAAMFGGEKVFLPPRIEAKHTRADIRRAKELLGWEPQVKFIDGMKDLFERWGLENK
ncbi:MAG: NAD-dependent epimerase/dehydratase family protein [Patescibacteria group bacterium]|nr:NAD-dependent epimerase/dehydratase family protein [Patescibacteria group bacterium]